MKNERGLTLVEALVTLLIFTFILFFTMSIAASSKAEHESQKNAISELSQNSYVFKLITSDLRKSVQVVTLDDSSIQLTLHDNSIVIYKYDETQLILYRNKTPLAEGLSAFDLNHSGKAIYLSLANKKNETIQTTIYIRGG